MQRILRLLATQVIFTKTEVCLACEPILKPSVFFGFSCEPEPYSKMLIIDLFVFLKSHLKNKLQT